LVQSPKAGKTWKRNKIRGSDTVKKIRTRNPERMKKFAGLGTKLEILGGSRSEKLRK